MKSEKTIIKVVSILLVMLIALFSTATVLAVDLDGDGIDDEITETVEPEYTESVYTDPVYTEPETEYIEPTTEYIEETTEQYAEETTEYVEPKTEEQPKQTEYIANEQSQQSATTEFVAPTVAKTVSQKKYETNYTAGIISWICVGVGVLVVLAVLLSTKVSGGKATKKRV